MPPAMKRPAARISRAEEPVAKKQVADSGLSGHVAKLCKQVSDAVLGSPEYPPEVSKMLVKGVTWSLGVPQEKRHAFQDNTIGMLRQVLDGLEAAAQSKVDEAEKKLEATIKENEERQNKVEAAAATLAEKTKMADVAKTTHSECILARVAAKEALTSAEHKQSTENAGLKVTELKKQRLEHSMETVYGALKTGEMPATEVQDGIRKLEKLGKDLGFDSSLIKTVPIALAKQPADRGSFDLVVMSQTEAEFQRFVVTFTNELANCEPGKKERADKVEAASNAHAQALAAEEAAKAEKEAARTAQVDAETEHKAMLKAQTQGGLLQGIATSAVQASKCRKKEFDEGPLAAFKELLELTEIPPPAPAPVEPECK